MTVNVCSIIVFNGYVSSAFGMIAERSRVYEKIAFASENYAQGIFDRRNYFQFANKNNCIVSKQKRSKSFRFCRVRRELSNEMEFI